MQKKGWCAWVKICPDALVVFHLLFVDDNFLFFRANERETMVVRNFLDDYAKAI